MTSVLIALDESPATRPVLEVGAAVARMAHAESRAVHVREHGSVGPVELAARHGVPLEVVEGPVVDSLLAALGRDGVVAAVVGARGTPSGPRPLGRVAHHLVAHSAKPVVVVPPDAAVPVDRVRRLLVPLEGSDPSSTAIARELLPLVAEEVEIVALHVLDGVARPPLLDHPRWDLDLWRREFLARHCPAATRVRIHTGSIGGGIRATCRREHPDLVVLSWSQVTEPDRAAVVRDVLAHSHVPVLLLPEAAQ